MSTSMMFSVSAIIVAFATIATIMGHTLTGNDITSVEVSHAYVLDIRKCLKDLTI